MKRSLALTTIAMLVLSGLLWVADASARVGGGGSSGSRGSRSYSAPARPSQSPVSPSQPAAPPSSPMQSSPQRSGWGGWGGMLGGLLVGGLIGSLLFGGLGHGMFGGIGFLEIAILAALAYLAFRFMRSRQSEPAAPSGYATAGGYGGQSWQPSQSSSYRAGSATLDTPTAPSDLDRGVSHIRTMDPRFDPSQFAEEMTDIFFKIQGAWTSRDLRPVASLLTPEMSATLERDCDRLKSQRRINRLENIAVRQAAITEAWQERGEDFVTVYFLASLLDYTTDESGTQLYEGSRTEPVKFEEYWTFTRPVGPNPWKLSAIQQAN